MVSVYGGMSHERKTKIWTMWQQGVPMSHMARDIKKPPATVYSYLLYHGGIEPKTRIRRSSYLTFEERETISRGIASRSSMRDIARQLDRHPSTISREISRNGELKRYRASLAEKYFLKNSKRPKPLLFGENDSLREIVACLNQTGSQSRYQAG